MPQLQSPPWWVRIAIIILILLFTSLIVAAVLGISTAVSLVA